MTDPCVLIRERLADYLAGRLDPLLAKALEAHVAGCPECAADVEAARVIGPLLDTFPRAKRPPRDLWRGISERIARRTARRWIAVPAWALAAAVLLLVAGTAVTTWLVARRESGATDGGGSFALAETRYSRSIADLSAIYARTRDSLPPETRATIERNLAVIEAAIGEVRAALDREPADPVLESLVLSAYRRKLEFLAQATGWNRDG